jgi:hypothetical protein
MKSTGRRSYGFDLWQASEVIPFTFGLALAGGQGNVGAAKPGTSLGLLRRSFEAIVAGSRNQRKQERTES